MDAKATPRVVLVHDWLTGMRGGEKCLDMFCRLWPDAPLYTLLHRRGSVSSVIEDRPLRTSFLQWLPQVHCYYRYLLPLMPLATGWRFPECDLVLSSSHCVAKSVKPGPGVPHVCYCHTPMRYAWQMRTAYLDSQGHTLKRSLIEGILERLRRWDRATADRVSHFIANSQTVRRRIADCYGRDSTVIYPPVDTDFYTPAALPREDYYLIVSAFAPYKRLDLAVTACTRLKRHLVIIGQGQQEKRLRALAGPEVHFLGWQPDEVIREQLRRCRALLFPGEEDFGIVPVEAQACGTPVIAFGRGGALETIVPAGNGREPTGLFFAEQTTDCLAAALTAFEKQSAEFAPAAARRQAVRFNRQRFAAEIKAHVAAVLRTPAPAQRAA